MSSSIPQKARAVRDRLNEDATLRRVTLVALISVVLAVAMAIFAFTQQARAGQLSAEVDQQEASLATSADELHSLRADVSKYEAAYLQSKRLDDREAAVSSRENALTARENEVKAAEAGLDTRQAEVQDRERRAAESLNASDWWVEQVRECLARSGSNRVATVTEGTLLGRDTTCYTQ